MSTTPQPRPRCAACSDTGFRRTAGGVVRCECFFHIPLRHQLPLRAHELRDRAQGWLHLQRGPMGEPLTREESYVLAVLQAHLGQQNAIAIVEIQRSLKRSDRHIKEMVRMLRVKHRIKVGSLRGSRERDAYGYFLCLTPREVDVTISARLAEVRSSLEVINALKGGLSHALAEVNGQLRLLFGGSSADG